MNLNGSRGLVFYVFTLLGSVACAEDEFRSYESHGPYCGVYSIVATAAALGKEVQPSILWTPEIVSGSKGSNAANLVYGLRSIGLDGTCHNGLSWLDLVESRNPLILHYRSTTSGANYGHWIAFLGANSDGKYVIFDPPFPAATVEPALVLANWDGFAVEVHNSKETYLNPYSSSLVLLSGFVAVVLCLALLKKFIPNTLNWKIQSALLCVVLTASTFGYHNQFRAGLFANRTAVAAVKDRYFATDLKEINLTELEQGMRRGSILIDTRRRSSFERGSIQGAISMPIDSSLIFRDSVLSRISRDAEIIVFCQSYRCDYSDKIARFLKFNGFSRIRIYRNGILEWEESHDLS